MLSVFAFSDLVEGVSHDGDQSVQKNELDEHCAQQEINPEEEFELVFAVAVSSELSEPCEVGVDQYLPPLFARDALHVPVIALCFRIQHKPRVCEGRIRQEVDSREDPHIDDDLRDHADERRSRLEYSQEVEELKPERENSE